ncbi:Protein argonaute-2, partial [Ophiophagus hannah]
MSHLGGCHKEKGVKLFPKAPEGKARSNGWKLIKERNSLELRIKFEILQMTGGGRRGVVREGNWKEGREGRGKGKEEGGRGIERKEGRREGRKEERKISWGVKFKQGLMTYDPFDTPSLKPSLGKEEEGRGIERKEGRKEGRKVPSFLPSSFPFLLPPSRIGRRQGGRKEGGREGREGGREEGMKEGRGKEEGRRKDFTFWN